MEKNWPQVEEIWRNVRRHDEKYTQSETVGMQCVWLLNSDDKNMEMWLAML